MARFLFVALFFLLFTLPADASEEDLRRLMAEASDFQAEYAKANRTQGQIEATEQDISGSELAVKEMFGVLQTGTLSPDPKTSPPNRCTQRSTDPRVVALCNAEMEKLNRWRTELLGQPEGKKKYGDQLGREQERLNQNKITWSDKKKSNKALLDVLDIAFQSWQRRYAALVFKSPPYNRLVSTKEGATLCKNPAPSGREALLEAAQGCLQWLWVSALQNS